MRVLVAIELGMRNHEWVPVHLIEKVSRMKRSNAFKIIKELLKNKLISHNSKKCKQSQDAFFPFLVGIYEMDQLSCSGLCSLVF